MELIYILILFLVFYKSYNKSRNIDEKLKIKGNPEFIHKDEVYVELYNYLKLIKHISL